MSSESIHSLLVKDHINMTASDPERSRKFKNAPRLWYNICPKKSTFWICASLRVFAPLCGYLRPKLRVDFGVEITEFPTAGAQSWKVYVVQVLWAIKLPGHCWYLQNANQLVRHVKRELPYYAASPSEGFSICWISSQTSTLQRACRREWICFEPTDIRELQHIDLKTKGLLLVFLPERLHSRLPFHRDPTGTNRPSHWFTIGPWNLV